MSKTAPLWILLILFLFSFPVFAETEDGGYADAFLQPGFGARALGMGGAFVGVADDATGGFFNPAGLVQLKNRTFGAFYRKMTLDRRSSYVTYNQPILEEATIGLAWINAGVGDVVGRNRDGEITGNLSNYENSIQMFYSRKIIEELSAGLCLEYVQYNLTNINAYGLGGGLSVMGRPIPKLRIGFSAENIGLKLSWTSGNYWKQFDMLGSSTKDEFPVNFRLGASYLLLKDRVLLSSEVDKSTKQEGKIHLGAEGWALENLAGRIGYDNGALTLGLGIRQKIRAVTFGFDYAYVGSHVGEDADHLISLQFEF
jgi:hypothetical protein